MLGAKGEPAAWTVGGAEGQPAKFGGGGSGGGVDTDGEPWSYAHQGKEEENKFVPSSC